MSNKSMSIISASSSEDAMRKIKELKAEKEALHYAPLCIRISSRVNEINLAISELRAVA